MLGRDRVNPGKRLKESLHRYVLCLSLSFAGRPNFTVVDGGIISLEFLLRSTGVWHSYSTYIIVLSQTHACVGPSFWLSPTAIVPQLHVPAHWLSSDASTKDLGIGPS